MVNLPDGLPLCLVPLPRGVQQVRLACPISNSSQNVWYKDSDKDRPRDILSFPKLSQHAIIEQENFDSFSMKTCFSSQSTKSSTGTRVQTNVTPVTPSQYSWTLKMSFLQDLSPAEYNGQYICLSNVNPSERGRHTSLAAQSVSSRFMLVSVPEEIDGYQPVTACQQIPGVDGKTLLLDMEIFAYPILVQLGQQECLVVNIPDITMVTWAKVDLQGKLVLPLHSQNQTNPGSASPIWPSFQPGMRFQGQQRQLVVINITKDLFAGVAFVAIVKHESSSKDPSALPEKTLWFYFKGEHLIENNPSCLKLG